MAFTFFFRDIQTRRLIEEHVLPSLKTRMYLDIWDAGCAHGPEPYSLAMILQENMGKFMFRNVRIFATDINDQFGDIVKNGVYPADQLKRIDPEIFQRHFSPATTPGHFIISEAVRKAVTFQRHDLTSLRPIRNGFGLILCKNVLLHLSPEQRIDVFKMFHSALNPDGYLATENTQKMPDELQGMFRQVRRDAQLFQKI
jgi:chemotaxis protein methyltransferase CheR